jgi:hypothetical protein
MLPAGRSSPTATAELSRFLPCHRYSEVSVFLAGLKRKPQMLRVRSFATHHSDIDSSLGPLQRRTACAHHDKRPFLIG